MYHDIKRADGNAAAFLIIWHSCKWNSL